MDRNLDSHQYFMLFGRGSRLYPGKELGTVEIATFLHYFVTRYRIYQPWDLLRAIGLTGFKGFRSFYIDISLMNFSSTEPVADTVDLFTQQAPVATSSPLCCGGFQELGWEWWGLSIGGFT